jgi:hypothetical protein
MILAMSRKPLLLKTSVSVDPGRDESGAPLYHLKLQTDAFEVNLRVRPQDVPKFEHVRSAAWERRGSLRIGEAAGSHAFWSVGGEGDDSIAVLIGRDDECWDIGLSFPPETIDAIRREIAACPSP